ncbi:MAG: Colicin V production protein [Firmicutes bacterium ADurb.Bin300]|nr:MAG: Colicin V production protein [Firmicutes bacterium ADurb.Bin300]
MEHIIDIILIVGFVLTVVFAVKKGFAKIVLNIGATVLSLLTAYLLSRPVAAFVYEKIIKGMIEKSLTEKLEKIPAKDALAQARALVDSIPEGLVSLGEKMGLSVNSLLEGTPKADISVGHVSAAVTESVFKPIVMTLATAVCGLLIFILASIVFGVLVKLINKVFKLPLIKSVNRALGGALGIVEGVIFLLVVSAGAYFLSGLIGGRLAEYVDNSVIIPAVNSINPIIKKFSGQ